MTRSGIPPAVIPFTSGCYGKDFTINAYGNTDITPLALFNSTSKSVVIYNNSGTFELGVGSLTGASITSGSGTFTVTFTNPVATSGSVFKLTLQSGGHTVVTCATGGSCIVGDRGPGGGIVYYVSANNFTSTGSNCNTTCRYLEVAPAGWNNGAVVADDPVLRWSVNQSVSTGQDLTTVSNEGPAVGSEKFNWKIGQGFYNTSVMKVAGASSTAQAAV